MQFERFYSLTHCERHGLHTCITKTFGLLSQIWGNVCDNNGVSVQPYVVEGAQTPHICIT
jgi:hypothetical protein